MPLSSTNLIDRLGMLGLHCGDVPTDRWSSAVSALACFPMYMVANVHAWTSARQFKVPVVDLPGSEALREAMTIGGQEALLGIEEEHRAVLKSLLTSAKAPDRVIYEYALEGLAGFLAVASPSLADAVRTVIARMIVAVAMSSGEGILGTGVKVSDEERACIAHIVETLRLTASHDALEILQGIGPA